MTSSFLGISKGRVSVRGWDMENCIGLPEKLMNLNMVWFEFGFGQQIVILYIVQYKKKCQRFFGYNKVSDESWEVGPGNYIGLPDKLMNLEKIWNEVLFGKVISRGENRF
jgi:hypothetical protein